MSNRNNPGRKPKPTMKVTLMDLTQMELVLPPICDGLNLKVVVEFDGKTTKLGLRSDGVKFDHDLKELMQFQGLSGVVARLTAEVKENRGKELAVALLSKNQEEKVLDLIAQKALLITQKGEQVTKLQEELEAHVAKADLEIKAKEIALKICKDMLRALAEFKSDPKGFDFPTKMSSIGIPVIVAERFSSPGYNIKGKELVSMFFPNDPRNHLTLSVQEIESGGIHRFMDILMPQNTVFLYYLLKKFLVEQRAQINEPKIAKFKWRFIPPVTIAQMWKNRDKTSYRVMGGDPAYQFEAMNMAFYGVPTQVITAPHSVLSATREFLWGKKTQDLAEARALAPEKPLDPKVFSEKFYSNYLKSTMDIDPSIEQKFEVKPPELKEVPDIGTWKIDTSKVEKIEKKKKKISFQKGSFPVRGKESEYLLKDILKTRYGEHRQALANYLTNYKGDVQEHVARVLYARLITGLVDAEDEVLDEDAQPDEAESDDDE